MRQNTKHIMILMLLMCITTMVRAGGDVEIVATNGTVTASVSKTENICTLTVKPDNDYYITRYDIVIKKMADASHAETRAMGNSPSISDDITPEGEEPSDLGAERTYSFQLQGDEYNYKVEATFRQKKIEVDDVQTNATDGSSSTTPQASLELSVSQDNNVQQKEVTVVDENTGVETTKTVNVVEVKLDNLSIPETTTGGGNPQEVAVAIPATITSSDGSTEYAIKEIGAGVLSNISASVTITEISLPTTDDPLKIATDAFKMDDLPAGDPNHKVLTIKSPLELLDDYTLAGSLQENVESGKLKATVTPPNHYWTFSCGVDVIVPDGITVYTCRMESNSQVEIIPIDDSALLVNGVRIIKANNGVLIACTDNSDLNAYEIVAATTNEATGNRPATGDAKSYGTQNLLEPVIERKNYNSEEYYVLKDNEFHSILNNSSKVPACKAVLKKPNH